MIIANCKSQDVNKKLVGINTLISFFSDTSCIEEQFNLLTTNVQHSLKALSIQPNPDSKEAYFQFGNFLFSMLFNVSYILDTNISFYSLKPNLNDHSLFFVHHNSLIDKEKQELINKYNNGKYQLVGIQKDGQEFTDELFRLCLQFLSLISNFDKIFDLQYVSYLILKRLYFIFPYFRKHIEDLISFVLVNVCLFTEKHNLMNSEECRNFIAFILANDSSGIKTKLENRLKLKNANYEQLKPLSSNECNFLIFFKFKFV